jgi:hypothetical protein
METSGLIIYDLRKPYIGQGLSFQEYIDSIHGLPAPIPIEKPFTPFLDLYNFLLNKR